jgi:serine/threonine protein phosphatase 1
VHTFAIGDIHGHSAALDFLLSAVLPQADDLLIFMGDYVDKGPDTKGVLDRLSVLSQRPNTIFLRGNHDQMMLDAYRDPEKVEIWRCLAGEYPLASYGSEDLDMVPPEHWTFLEDRCQNYHETNTHIYVHAGLRAQVSPSDETPERLQWTTLELAGAHHSGKLVICGHTAQHSGLIADLGHTICIDTGMSRNGWLTCLSVDRLEFLQANDSGRIREGMLRGS